MKPTNQPTFTIIWYNFINKTGDIFLARKLGLRQVVWNNRGSKLFVHPCQIYCISVGKKLRKLISKRRSWWNQRRRRRNRFRGLEHLLTFFISWFSLLPTKSHQWAVSGERKHWSNECCWLSFLAISLSPLNFTWQESQQRSVVIKQKSWNFFFNEVKLNKVNVSLSELWELYEYAEKKQMYKMCCGFFEKAVSELVSLSLFRVLHIKN